MAAAKFGATLTVACAPDCAGRSAVMRCDLAVRPVPASGLEQGVGSRMMSVSDPETGLSLRLEVTRQYKQTMWEFDILWGVKLVRPELVVAIHG